MQVRRSKQEITIFFYDITRGYALPVYGWSVDAAAGRLNVIVIQAIHLAVPSRCIKKRNHRP